MAKRESPRADRLRARGLITSDEVIAGVTAKGWPIKAHDLWYLQRRGVIPKPIIAGIDAVRRRVAWYPRATIERILQERPQKRLGRKRPPTFQEVVQEEFRRSVLAFMHDIPDAQCVELEAEAIASRFQALEEARAVTGPWVPTSPKSKRVPSVDEIRELMLLGQLQGWFVKQTPEDLARKPVTDEEKVAAFWKLLSPEGRAAWMLNGYAHELDQETRKWSHPAVGTAVFLLRDVTAAREALARGERGRAHFMLTRIEGFARMTIDGLAKTFGKESEAAPAPTVPKPDVIVEPSRT